MIRINMLTIICPGFCAGIFFEYIKAFRHWLIRNLSIRGECANCYGCNMKVCLQGLKLLNFILTTFA